MFANSIIAHLDMDAFFAAVEERNNPRFAGKPIAVGADPESGRGVLSTANYAARKYGLHSAMPVRKAWQLSEAARHRGEEPVIFLRGSWRTYSRISQKIMNHIQAHSPTIQQRGVDEAYFDLSHTSSIMEAIHVATELKNAIKRSEDLTASIGIGPNKLIAKIASDHDKPDGLTVVPADAVQSFLDPLPVRTIPGIGPKAGEKLRRLNIHSIYDLRACTLPELHYHFGKWGEQMYERAHGRGSTSLVSDRVRKSVGRDRTFGEDTLDVNYVTQKCMALCEQAVEDLHQEELHSWRTVTLRVRFADFVTRSRAHTAPQACVTAAQLKLAVLHLLLPFFDHRENAEQKQIRLVGVRLSKLR